MKGANTQRVSSQRAPRSAQKPAPSEPPSVRRRGEWRKQCRPSLRRWAATASIAPRKSQLTTTRAEPPCLRESPSLSQRVSPAKPRKTALPYACIHPARPLPNDRPSPARTAYSFAHSRAVDCGTPASDPHQGHMHTDTRSISLSQHLPSLCLSLSSVCLCLSHTQLECGGLFFFSSFLRSTPAKHSRSTFCGVPYATR